MSALQETPAPGSLLLLGRMEEDEVGGMIPLGDASRRPAHIPVVTVLIILVNALVFVRELMGGGAVPVCVKDYARDENVIARVDPVFTERTFNPVPVRIIIDKAGKVKHIHFLSAFPDQARAITDALRQWKFKPYLRNRQPVEVETGIMFGRAPHPATPSIE